MTSPAQKQLWLQAALLGLAAALILYPLSVFWSLVPDYSYGWGVPFLAIFLFLERWPSRPPRQPLLRLGPSWQLWLIVLLWAFALLISRMVLEANIGWRPMQWLQASLLISGLFTWLVLYGGWNWARHFAFPVAFLFLVAPWLFSLVFAITQNLMILNAQLAADTLILADIPAQAMGHTIQLGTCQLGVDEACSGIRSLQGSLMMALFLGEFYRFRLSQRGLLLLLAVLLALFGNYLRMVFLALQGAYYGLDAVHAWHDDAGLFIMAFTVVSLWLVALLLERWSEKTASIPTTRPQPSDTSSPALARQTRTAFQLALAFCLIALSVELLTQGWFSWRQATAPHALSWTVELPQNEPDFKILPIPDNVTQILHYDRAITAHWRDAQNLQWSVNWFRYYPKASDRVSVDWHDPNVCLPAAGLVKEADYGCLDHTVSGLHLQPQVYLFRAQDTGIYIFWLVYLNQTDLLVGAKRPGNLGSASNSLFLNRLSWFQDAWYGRRGLDAETLEIGLTGPRDLESAKSAYLKLLDSIVKPEAKP